MVLLLGPEMGIPAIFTDHATGLRRAVPLLATIGCLVCAFLLSGCSVNSSKKNYVLAEKLWADGKYAASVTEFEKVIAKDPSSKLAQQALFRAAMTQAFFLSQYRDAIRKFRSYVQANKGQPGVWDTEKLIGEILFSKMDEYDQAIQHYRQLLQQKPNASEAPEFVFRIGKSHFYLAQFDRAISTYYDLTKHYAGTAWAEKAAFEIGVTHYTRGAQHSGGRGPGMEAYQEAIDSYQKFLRRYPNSEYVSQAKFGIAACLEELDQLDAAYHAYEALKSSYPSPKVIEIKLARIRERKAQRSR